jgi:hypothetical protein
MSGKVQILNVFVDDPDQSFVVYFRLAAGSDDTAPGDILWQVFCEDPDGGAGATAATDRTAGEFDDTAGDGGTSLVIPLDANGAAPAVATTVEAGISYRVEIDVNDDVDQDCSPTSLFNDNTRASMYVHVVGGGSTFDILKVNDASRGAVVV